MHTRLKELRNALHINQTEFARRLGISQTAYSMIESGRRPLSEKYIRLMVTLFRVSESWLRTGEGDMFADSPYTGELTEIFDRLDPATQQSLLVIARELLRMQQRDRHAPPKDQKDK